MSNAAQFRVIPTVQDQSLLVLNARARKYLAAVLANSQPGEKTKDRKLREAMARELETPTEAPILFDPDAAAPTTPAAKEV